MDSKKTFSKLLELHNSRPSKVVDLENGVLEFKRNTNIYPPYSTKSTPPTITLYGLDLIKKIVK